MGIIPKKKINMVTYFENIIVRLHVLYILDKYFKLFFMHNFIL